MPKTCPHCGQAMPKQVRFSRATVRRLQYIGAHSTDTESSVATGTEDDHTLIAWGFATERQTSSCRAMFTTRVGAKFLVGVGRVSRLASVVNNEPVPIGKSRLVNVYELMGASYNEPTRPVGEPVRRADAPAST